MDIGMITRAFTRYLCVIRASARILVWAGPGCTDTGVLPVRSHEYWCVTRAPTWVLVWIGSVLLDTYSIM